MVHAVLQNVLSRLPRRLVQYLAGITASLTFAIVGAVTAWSSPEISFLESSDSPIIVTPDEASWIVSVYGIGNIVSPILAIFFINCMGRKIILMLAMIPIIVSFLIIMFASSVTMLLVSRCMSGFGVGFIFIVCPMYIGEIAEKNVRGILGSLMQLFLSLGLLFVYCVGPFVSMSMLALLMCIFPVLFLFIITFMHDTPYYLLMKGQRQKAESSLVSFRGKRKEDIQEELDQMQQSVEEQMQNKGTLRDLLINRNSRHALLIIVGLILVQQFSGANAMNSYTEEIFSLTPGTQFSSSEEAMITGAIQLISGLITVSLVDYIGRRPLLFASTLGCSVSLAVMGAYQYIHLLTDTNTSSYDWLPLVCLVGYFVFYNLGIGTLPTAIMGEMFPTNVKGLACSLCSILLGICFSTVTKLYQVVSDNFGAYTMFWIYSGVCVFGMFFVLFFVPETKGKFLGTIVTELKGNVVISQLRLNGRAI